MLLLCKDFDLINLSKLSVEVWALVSHPPGFEGLFPVTIVCTSESKMLRKMVFNPESTTSIQQEWRVVGVSSAQQES